MRHFFLFLVLVFAGLASALLLRNKDQAQRDARPPLRIFASSSFIAQWGPGPLLKNKFEETCDCRIEYFDSADSTIMLQRLKSDSRAAADLVLGFDQFDLESVTAGVAWNKIGVDSVEFEPEVQAVLANSDLVPYNWGIMNFVFRRSQTPNLPKKMDDLLRPDLKGQIALQDPRTSSPGLQFVLWLIQSRGEESAFSFLKQMQDQVHSYSPGWSASYGLFQKGQVKTVLSYATSPIYHLVEEQSADVVAAEFIEGHPAQFEYLGIPAQCQQCELAQKYVDLVLSKEGQRIVMEKNYMFPVVRGVREGTAFADVPRFKTLPNAAVPSLQERERIMKRWSALRRGE